VTLQGNFFDYLNPLVVLTGAGISAESGIPTFRGDQGLWREFRAEHLASPEAFENDPHLVWQFYDWRRQIVANSNPNPAHHALTQIGQCVDDFSIITQNVDGLHKRAGNRNIIELHGSLWVLKCTCCNRKWEDHQVPFPQLPPQCPSCNSLARPDVVWFGEMLDSATLAEAHRSAANARTMLVIGTSALVQPASLLPHIALNAGAQVIEFNVESTALTPFVDEMIAGSVAQTLPTWWNNVSGKLEG
jgi:NAD-dependent deacetylase